MIYRELLESLQSNYVSLSSPLKDYESKDSALFYKIKPKKKLQTDALDGLILNEINFNPTKTYSHLKALKRSGAVEIDLKVLKKMFFESKQYSALVEEFDNLPNFSRLSDVITSENLEKLLQKLKRIFEDNVFESERENFVKNMKISISAEADICYNDKLILSHLGFIVISTCSVNKRIRISFNNILIASFSDINSLI